MHETRKIRIVSDSSGDLLHMDGVSFGCAPMTVITDEREFRDDETLDLAEMNEYFAQYKERSHTSCPNVQDWLAAFGDADDIFCTAITSRLSGSYSAACAAKKIYEESHPGARVFVVDTLSAGPEITLLLHRIREMVAEGLPFEEICEEIGQYTAHTGLLFMLSSLQNFAANGRVSPAAARLVGLFGIRVVGKASDEGELEPLTKCRGEMHALKSLAAHMRHEGYCGGKVRIAHCRNLGAAEKLREILQSVFLSAEIEISELRGLCSYYAQDAGLLVGFEKR